MKRTITIAVAALSIGACASVPLTAEEDSVRIMRKSDPPLSCKALGKVLAPGMASLTEEGRDKDLKRATRKLGGNVVTIDSRDEYNSISGTAYNCP